jgi:hypothetical protein
MFANYTRGSDASNIKVSGTTAHCHLLTDVVTRFWISSSIACCDAATREGNASSAGIQGQHGTTAPEVPECSRLELGCPHVRS